jgi:hypothetical protein
MSHRTLLLLALTVLGACSPEVRRGDPDLQVAVAFEPDPPTVGTADIQVDLSDLDWTPRNGDRVILTGSRDDIVLATDTAQGRGAGTYRAEGFRFEVAGHWTLTVRVETRDGRWVEIDRPVEVVAGDGS